MSGSDLFFKTQQMLPADAFAWAYLEEADVPVLAVNERVAEAVLAWELSREAIP